jgi:hypothetical protein
MNKPGQIELIEIVAPIAPPPEPPPYGWIMLGVTMGLVLGISAAVLGWRRSRDRRGALLQLKLTECALQQQHIDPRVAVFQAARALQRVCRPASTVAHAHDWTDFLRALDHARYAPQLPSAQDSMQLLARTRQWILHPPC